MTEQTTSVEEIQPESGPQAGPRVAGPASEAGAAELEAAGPQAVERPSAEQPLAGPEAGVLPSPGAPPVAAVEGDAVEVQAAPAKAKKNRRVLRAVLRWTAATVVFAAVGSAAAYGITGMERTDVPGLATKSDGRWDYPTIVKPPLPSGSPGPFAEANKAGAHYADLRKLLLPAPQGAKADAALRGEDGWLPRKTFLAQFGKANGESVDQMLTDYGLRHVAARGWTVADGTRTRVYLLQFGTATAAYELVTDQLANYDSPTHALRGADLTERDELFPDKVSVDEVVRFAYTESKPYGAEQAREAYLLAGDTVALIVQTRKGKTPEIPFQQTVVLQSQLLG
ncbi:hypothetical protein ACICHK_18925 [Streptomyces sp. AHU1]|uniref:hypothetical protein n=1 Tax=Streptomyces sp. AHU1 TaxID=3377215 RepID=UPI003877C199